MNPNSNSANRNRRPSTIRRNSSRRQEQLRGMTYQSLEERRMLSSNLPDVDGQISLTREYLFAQAETQYLLQDRSDLQFIEMKHGLASTTTRFQQTIDGMPVHGSIITINQNGNGEFQQVHHELAYEPSEATFPELQTNIPFTVSAAESAAMEHAGVTFTLAPTRGQLSWYVDATSEIHQVWDLMVFSGLEPVGDFLSIVDINTSEVLHQENWGKFANGSGLVYEPNPWQTQGSGAGLADNDDANSTVLTDQLIDVTLERLNEGTGLLIGEWVDVATLDSPTLDDVDADEPTRVYNYTRDDARFEQVVVYHTVDQLNAYFHELGFDDDTGTPNGIRDFPTLANAHWFDADQSFYSSGNDAIHMGDGGVDDGEDADIIAHEYGHAVQNNQNSAWGGGEMGAMGEGFGDWLAAAFYMNTGDAAFQDLHAAAVGEWDALSYSSDDPPNLRRVDGNKQYPDDLGFGVHADGEIWSRALWDLTANVGRDASMQLVLEHHFMVPASATMTQAAETLMMANTNLFDGNSEAAVRHPFVARGILPAEAMVSFDQSLYQSDDVITIQVSDALLPPGPGTTAVITTADGDVEVVNLTDTGNGLLVGTINISDTGVATNDGFVGVQAALTEITVTYAASSGLVMDTAEIEADIEIIEGTDGDDVIVVTVGENFTIIDVNGTEFPVDRNVASSSLFDAKGGYDRITVIDSSGDDTVTVDGSSVMLEGDFSFIGDNVEWVSLVSGGGSDVARLFGSDLLDDVFSSDVDATILSNDTHRYATQGFDQVLAYGRGGNNSATLVDSTGSDRLSITPVFANLRMGSHVVNARGFADVTVRSVNGGFDVAVLNGGESADFLYATPSFARLTSGDVSMTAVGFERTNTKGNGGDDRATLIGSEFDDRFTSRPRNSYLIGESFLNQVIDFEVVNAEGNGGIDFANLIDSPGDDTLFATPMQTTLFNDQHRARATGFFRVTAHGSAGFDNATLVGSAGNDRFVSRPNNSYLFGEGYFLHALDFNRVSARAMGGADNTAALFGSAEDNRFFGSQATSYLFGSTFFNAAEGFRVVTVGFPNDALFVGTLVDSSSNDRLIANGSQLTLLSDDYSIHTKGLDRVVAKSENGGLDRAFTDLATLDIDLLGDWS